MKKEYQQGYTDGFQKRIAKQHLEYDVLQWRNYKFGYIQGYQQRSNLDRLWRRFSHAYQNNDNKYF